MKKSERRKLGEGSWQPGELRIGVPSKEQLEAIGRITTNFAALESFIQSCVWDLIGKDQAIGRIVTVQRMSFSSLLDLLVALHRYRVPINTPRGEKSAKLLQELLSQISEAGIKRNVIAHSVWLVDGIHKEAKRTKAISRRKKEFKDDIEDVSADKLNGIANFIEDVFFQMGKLWKEIQFFPHRKNNEMLVFPQRKKTE